MELKTSYVTISGFFCNYVSFLRFLMKNYGLATV